MRLLTLNDDTTASQTTTMSSASQSICLYYFFPLSRDGAQRCAHSSSVFTDGRSDGRAEQRHESTPRCAQTRPGLLKLKFK